MHIHRYQFSPLSQSSKHTHALRFPGMEEVSKQHLSHMCQKVGLNLVEQRVAQNSRPADP